MTAIVLRIIVLAVVFGLIFWGVSRIIRDWRNAYRVADEARHRRDVKERARPDVVTLKRDKDGKFRPPDDPAA